MTDERDFDVPDELTEFVRDDGTPNGASGPLIGELGATDGFVRGESLPSEFEKDVDWGGAGQD